MSKVDNPTAFPRPASKGNNYLTGEEDVVIDPQDGMRLLDWFAGQVVRGLASRCGQEVSARWLAKQAYLTAKEMVEAPERSSCK